VYNATRGTITGVIYLDHAATTPMRAAARDAMAPFMTGRFGNPSGLYALGRDAQAALDEARTTVAECLGARPSEILFTSGGTESINTAMLGMAYAMRRAGAGDHVITTAIEHHAGLHTAQFLEELGFRVTYVGCDSAGRVSMAEVERELQPGTVMVSVMLANNEVGTVQPVADIAALIRRQHAGTSRPLVHTDAVQCPAWMDLNVGRLGVDALSLSGHKFGGPRGTGVLYLRRATPFRQLLHGGGQESQKRAGTENVAGIAGLATALAEASTGVANRAAAVRSMRDRLKDRLTAALPGVTFNGCQADCVPNNLSAAFEGIESDALVLALDRAGVAVSSGSACSQTTWEPSHVLLAMGVPMRQATSSIRFSLSESTTAEEVDAAAALVAGTVRDLRAR
jgi:cysteine desulfurase